MESKTARISKTGVARGSGSDRYRYVAYLSDDDKAAIAAGDVVLVERNAGQSEKHGRWYVVTGPFNGKYGHRLPTDDEQALIEAAGVM